MGFKREKINDYFLLDTGVENIFINEYMASAPGDFVKVYLFALMYAGLGGEISNEKIARYLSMEDEDVRKAWNYWEKLGVIRKLKKTPEDKYEYDVEFIVLKDQLYGEKNTRKAYASSEGNTPTIMEDKEIKDMFAAIQKATGRVFDGREVMEVLSWIDDFNAAPEIIVYAYSYCIQLKKTNINYIKAVVKSWASQGLRDVLAVEEHLASEEKRRYLYKRVFQALGFPRNPTEEEQRIMDTWFETMDFTLDTVIEACKMTTGIANPNINYINKVLTGWYEDKKKGLPTGRKKGKEAALTTGQIMTYYEDLRRRNEQEAEERRRRVYEALPRIKELEDQQTSLSAEMSRVIISNRVDRKDAMEELRAKMDAINMEKAFLLTDNGFEMDYMDVKHQCPICKDTGMLETGERCQCFGEVTKEKIQLMNRQKTE